MKLNVDSSKQLMQIVVDDALFDNLKQQIEKDFILANITIKIPEKVSPIQLVALIREKMYYLMMEHFAEYLNLMYIIDIPEKDFQNIVITDTVDVSDQVTLLILKREYRKVWYRNRYQ
ncbi:hypothetical protein [uncultured Maribacter sp.]|uniref:hypothetical protein n=1 Tax=uncultured Maribacter sp. TaxID=431308 RepID=UPI0026141673|nr:hypothetical protein [uncultured Maribacter sp.]